MNDEDYVSVEETKEILKKKGIPITTKENTNKLLKHIEKSNKKKGTTPQLPDRNMWLTRVGDDRYIYDPWQNEFLLYNSWTIFDYDKDESKIIPKYMSSGNYYKTLFKSVNKLIDNPKLELSNVTKPVLITTKRKKDPKRKIRHTRSKINEEIKKRRKAKQSQTDS